MNNSRSYFKIIDLSKQKSISSEKLKDLITSTIKWDLATMKEAESIIEINLYYDQAYALLSFAHAHLCLYSTNEFNDILEKIRKETTKSVKEL